jgi:ABC-2 type transport system permease protein
MSVRLFFHFIRLILRTRREYRGDFLLGMTGQIIGYAANYLVVWMLLQRFETINGWSWPEIAFLYSLNLFTYALGASFTFSSMTSLDQLVIDGSFDKYLVKPLHPFFYLTANLFNLGYIAHILISGSVLWWSMMQISIHWTFIKLLYLLLTIVSGTFLQAAVIVIIGSLVFFFTRVQFLFQLYFRLKDFIAYPISIYGVIIQLVLTWVVPLAFINFYPSLFLLEKNQMSINHWLGWMIPICGPVMFWIAYKLWEVGLNKYQGAGG